MWSNQSSTSSKISNINAVKYRFKYANIGTTKEQIKSDINFKSKKNIFMEKQRITERGIQKPQMKLLNYTLLSETKQNTLSPIVENTDIK